MSLLVISAVFPPEPVVSAKLSFDLASKISEEEQVLVISPPPTRPMGFELDYIAEMSSFEHILAKSYTCPQSSIIGRFRESYSFGKQCSKYLAANHKDIKLIYANTWPLMAQFLCVKAAKKYKIPVVIHVQDIYPESLTTKLPFLKRLLTGCLMPIDRYVLRNSSKVIAISNKMKDQLIRSRKIDSQKVAVIANWQDEAHFINSSESEPLISGVNVPFTFMYLGNIGPVAGVDLLIDTFVNAAIPNSRLVIAGSGSMKNALEEYVSQNRFQGIEFWPVPEGKVPEVQSKANVLMLPVKKGAAMSSIPSKLPAYMFSKKPIIASVDKGSDTADVIQKANCGLLVSPENEDELSETMKYVASLSEGDLVEMGICGFHYAMENYSKKKNLPRLVNLLNEISDEIKVSRN